MNRLLIVLLVLAACGSNEHTWTAQEEESMARLMADVHMAQAALKRASMSTRDSIEGVYWSQLSAIHGKSREELQNGIEQLKEDPEMLEKILERAEDLIDSLKSGPKSPINLNK